MRRRGLGLFILAGVVTLAPATWAQRCRKTYKASNGFCCPANKEFDKKVGDCVTPGAPTPVVTAEAAPTKKVTIHPHVTAPNGATVAKPTILVNGQTAKADDTFEVEGNPQLVRVDIKAPGYEDHVSYVPAVADVPLDAKVQNFDNLSIRIVGEPGTCFEAHAEVYVDCPKSIRQECMVSKANAECNMHFAKAECALVHVRVVGNVNTELNDVPIDDDKITTVKLVVHESAPPKILWAVPIGLTVASVGLLVAGLALSDSTASQTALAFGAGVGALDFTLGGYLVGQLLAPKTTVTPFVNDDKLGDVHATLARDRSRSSIKVSLAPTGLVLRW